MFVAGVLTLCLCCFHQTSGVIHSYQYIYTATSEIPNIPRFSVVGSVDGQQILYYDSEIKEVVPRQEWVVGAVDADFWKRNTGVFSGNQPVYLNNVEVVKSRFNQTDGVHTVQRMYGCQWDDESEATEGFEQFGYDGEDFISMDLKNLVWIATTPQSLISKQKLDMNRALNENQRNYYSQICIDWLKKYLQYASSTLERKVRPKVTLLQKDSKVLCHATGFYPEAVMITWKRDGEEMLEDVDVGETLINDDGTFQKRAVLTVSPEEFKNRQYTCEVAHKSGETIIVDEIEIQPRNPDSSFPLGTIIGVVVPIVLIAIVAGFFILRKKKNADNKAGFSRANTDESSQSSGEKA